jgi:hypothetical protein
VAQIGEIRNGNVTNFCGIGHACAAEAWFDGNAASKKGGRKGGKKSGSKSS